MDTICPIAHYARHLTVFAAATESTDTVNLSRAGAPSLKTVATVSHAPTTADFTTPGIFAWSGKQFYGWRHRYQCLFCNSNIVFPQECPRRRVRTRQTAPQSATGVTLSRNPVNAAVALAAVLGSRTAATSATESLITHGMKESRLATVRCWQSEFVPCIVFVMSLTIIHGGLVVYPQQRLS